MQRSFGGVIQQMFGLLQFSRMIHSHRTGSLQAIVLVLATFVCTSTAAADSAYSWKDSNGRTIYGSRPPKNAGAVTRMNPRGLSRYSSDKVLKRLGRPQATSRSRLSKPSSSANSSDSFSFEPALLVPSSVLINRDAELAVTSCSVEVENAGSSAAKNVSVAFEFPDGSLVPAVGPDEIAAGESSVYRLPAELTPMKIKLPEDQHEKVMEDPMVIVHGVAQ